MTPEQELRVRQVDAWLSIGADHCQGEYHCRRCNTITADHWAVERAEMQAAIDAERGRIKRLCEALDDTVDWLVPITCRAMEDARDNAVRVLREAKPEWYRDTTAPATEQETP